METPLPNDSLIASLSPPVGGRLRSFRRDWQTNQCSSNMLNIITNGYILPFLSKPNLVRFPLIVSEYKARQKDQALATCIQSLLSKNAIERVQSLVTSRQALAREGDYEMMPVCACVRACVRAMVSHADSSKTTTATDFL